MALSRKQREAAKLKNQSLKETFIRREEVVEDDNSPIEEKEDKLPIKDKSTESQKTEDNNSSESTHPASASESDRTSIIKEIEEKPDNKHEPTVKEKPSSDNEKKEVLEKVEESESTKSPQTEKTTVDNNELNDLNKKIDSILKQKSNKVYAKIDLSGLKKYLKVRSMVEGTTVTKYIRSLIAEDWKRHPETESMIMMLFGDKDESDLDIN